MWRQILQQCRVHERMKICFPHLRKQMQGLDGVLIGSAHPLIARSESRLILPCRGETLCLSRTHSLCSPVRDSDRSCDVSSFFDDRVRVGSKR